MQIYSQFDHPLAAEQLFPVVFIEIYHFGCDKTKGGDE